MTDTERMLRADQMRNGEQRTQAEQMLRILETELLPKILGFCRLKLNSEQDAEDLAQDICLELIGAIHSGKQIENLGAFAWGVSNHKFFGWLRRKRYGSTAYLTDVFAAEDDIEKEYILGEQKQLLHRELSILSDNYRKAVVMFYYDGMSCEEIAYALGRSAGTVKWWLHDARKEIERGMNTTREYGEKSYRPGTLFVSCQGMPGANMEPVSCAKRKSAQNILLAAYKNPLSVEELSLELGIAAPYIEDEVQYLTKNQLMKEMPGGRYQTDFVILPGENLKLGDKLYETVFPEYSDKLFAFLESKKPVLSGGQYNIAGFSWERLLWVYIHIVTEIAVGKFKYDNNIHVKYQDIPDRPAGGKWIALGYESGFESKAGVEYKDYHPWDGPVNKLEGTFVQGFFHSWSGVDSTVFFDTPDEVFVLCRDIIKGDLYPEHLDESQKYLFSIALENRLFLKTEDGFRPNYYYVPSRERHEIEKMAHEFYREAEACFTAAYELARKEYLSTIPKHLHWQMGNFLSNILNQFVTCSLHNAMEAGMLSRPDEDNKTWLSLFASES